MKHGWHNYKEGLLYGNGCRRWDNCFTCPWKDCMATYDDLSLPKKNTTDYEAAKEKEPCKK